MEASAIERWPETFAGLWIDHNTGTVKIAFTQDASTNVEQLGRQSTHPERLQAVTLGRPLAELEQLQQRMLVARELARAGEFSLPGVPGHYYDLGIDLERNAVKVYLEDPNQEAIAAFHERYGKDLVFEQGIVHPGCDARKQCQPLLRSGLNTAFDEYDSWDTACSTGFTIIRPNGERGILSAAHCRGQDISNERRHDWHCIGIDCFSHVYGHVTGQELGGRVDAEMHSVGGQWDFEARAWIFRNNDHKAWSVDSVGDWSNFDEGAYVCKAGVVTNETCGIVTDKFAMPNYVPNGNRFIEAHYCARPGDSGAGVYGHYAGAVPHRAQGIHSGQISGDCDSPNRSVFGHIEYVQNVLNVTVVQAN